MPAMLRAQPDTRPVAKPQPAALGLPLRHFETLPPPDPLDHRHADLPARMAEQGMDTAVAVTAIIPGQRNNVGRQALLVGIVPRRVALRRAVLAEYPAGPPLRYRQCTTDLLDRLTTTGGAQKVSFDAS